MNIRILISLLCYSLALLLQAVPVKNSKKAENLREEANGLLVEWMDAFLDYQCTFPDRNLTGGVLCPACARVHGRIGDAVLPLMYLADKTGNDKYLHGAERLMSWMENIHRPDGSWMNDVHVSDWNGTTVFAAIALYEALHHYGHLLNDSIRNHWTGRLIEAGEFMMANPFIYSRKRDGMRNMNVNYSASATYALYAIGQMCGRPEFMSEARTVAEDLKFYFTAKDCFLYGEGPNIWTETTNGCRPVDLLYNVEESLPNLAHYAELAGDNDIKELVKRSMDTHLEFMLPDGAWDNSWGTRSFKWTYWGGRTSDGFMGGYGLMALQNPAYIEAIRRNVRLLKKATHGGLLYGGMHYRESGIAPCIHHTFGHAKALASFLEQPEFESHNSVALPRDVEYGMKFFPDIRTWLLSQGEWRATFTGYDAEYKVKGTHPMGGALSMLWHSQYGPVFAATMNKYTLIEAPNMQSHQGEQLMSGTPRVETVKDGITYSNLDDLDTEIECEEIDGGYRFVTRTHLVDINQRAPLDGEAQVTVIYTFTYNGVKIEMENCCPDSACLMLPIIASPTDKVSSDKCSATIKKPEGLISLTCGSGQLEIAACDDNGRIFNPVPGFSFVPFKITPDSEKNVKVDIVFNNY